jgi:hypothetical protein
MEIREIGVLWGAEFGPFFVGNGTDKYMSTKIHKDTRNREKLQKTTSFRNFLRFFVISMIL